MVRAVTLLIISTLATPALAQDVGPWKKVRDRNNITVFNRTTSEALFKEFKGVTKVDATIEQIVGILTNPTLCTQWMTYCEDSYFIDPPAGDPASFVYTVTDSPWPAADRDVVLASEHFPNTDGAYVIRFNARPEVLPQREDFIRIELLRGTWTLKPEQDGTTRIIYQVLCNPGGNIPPWLINIGSVEQPYRTLKNLKEILADRTIAENL